MTSQKLTIMDCQNCNLLRLPDKLLLAQYPELSQGTEPITYSDLFRLVWRRTHVNGQV